MAKLFVYSSFVCLKEGGGKGARRVRKRCGEGVGGGGGHACICVNMTDV